MVLITLGPLDGGALVGWGVEPHNVTPHQGSDAAGVHGADVLDMGHHRSGRDGRVAVLTQDVKRGRDLGGHNPVLL